MQLNNNTKQLKLLQAWLVSSTQEQFFIEKLNNTYFFSLLNANDVDTANLFSIFSSTYMSLAISVLHRPFNFNNLSLDLISGKLLQFPLHLQIENCEVNINVRYIPSAVSNL